MAPTVVVPPPPTTWDPGARAARAGERELLRRSRPLPWFLLHGVLRNRREFFNVPRIGYVITGAEACREAILDQELFAKDGEKGANALVTQVMGPTALLNMDGAEHLDLRRRLQGLFTPKYVDAVCAIALSEIADEIRATLRAGRDLDLALMGRRVTGTMMCHMVGIELEGDALQQRALRMFDLGRQLAERVPTRLTHLDPVAVADAQAIFAQLVEGVDEVHASGPATTIPGRLRELGLTPEEARGVVGMLLIAGTETTASAISRIVALLHDTGQWARLQADRSLLPGTIDEGLRIAAPVPVVTRTSRAGTFRGHRIKADRTVLIALTRAMRDPAVIARGDDFDIGREQPGELRRLFFGAGPHFCLGFALATKELTAVLEALLDGAPDLEIVEREAARGVLLPSWQRMIVRRREERA